MAPSARRYLETRDCVRDEACGGLEVVLPDVFEDDFVVGLDLQQLQQQAQELGRLRQGHAGLSANKNKLLRIISGRTLMLPPYMPPMHLSSAAFSTTVSAVRLVQRRNILRQHDYWMN